MQRMEVSETGEGDEPVGSEGEDIVNAGKDSDLEEGCVSRVVGSLESGQGNEEVVVVMTEGETPIENRERETPIVMTEGETPDENVEGETPVELAGGEIPIEMAEGGTLFEGDDDVGNQGRGAREGVVVLVDKSGEEMTPIDEKTTRRTTRRSRMVEELVETTRPRKLQFGASVEEGDTKAGDSEAEEKRLAAERKRKGKLEASPLTKKYRPASTALVIEEPMPQTIRVPFAKELERPGAGSETEDEEDAEQQEEPAYEITEVLVTRRLLEAIEEFDDPKRAQTYKERGVSGKLIKSGKRYDPESLQEIESEEEFLGYIGDI